MKTILIFICIIFSITCRAQQVLKDKLFLKKRDSLDELVLTKKITDDEFKKGIVIITDNLYGGLSLHNNLTESEREDLQRSLMTQFVAKEQQDSIKREALNDKMLALETDVRNYRIAFGAVSVAFLLLLIFTARKKNR